MKFSRSNLIWGVAAVLVSSFSSSVLASDFEDSQLEGLPLEDSQLENSQLEVSPFSDQPIIFSAKALIDQSAFFLSPVFEFKPQQFDYSISIEDKNYVQNLLEKEPWKLSANSSITNADFVNKQVVALKKKPYLYDDSDEDIIIGQHNTFWGTSNKQKYWGLTTVKTWGLQSDANTNTFKGNAKNSSLLLAPGASALTISGGRANGLRDSNTLVQEVDDLQGGVAFHQSVAEDVTIGVGFVFEDSLSGFSQFTYQPDDLPVQTTVSFLHDGDKLDFYSHLKLQPSDKIVLNVYGDHLDQKFDFNLGLISGLTLTADGNSETEMLRAGAKVAVKHNSFSLLAKAQLDINNDVQWQLNSKLGRFKLDYASDKLKTKTAIVFDVSDFKESDFQLSLFFNNQARYRRTLDDNLSVWGWNVHSANKLANNRNLWEIDLGYGIGSAGDGVIANVSAALNPALSVKLSYEEISLVGDGTNIKLQLSSF